MQKCFEQEKLSSSAYLLMNMNKIIKSCSKYRKDHVTYLNAWGHLEMLLTIHVFRCANVIAKIISNAYLAF